MADTQMDGYMYFVGEGKFGPEKKSIGKIKGETLDTRFDTHGAFKIWSFSWQSAHNSATTTDEDIDDGPDIATTSGPAAAAKKRRSQLRVMSSNRMDALVNVGAFEVSKDVDVASPTIFLAHAHCAVFEGCHIYFRKTGGGKLFTFFHAVFSDVIIERWDCNFDSGATEKLVVNFNWCQLNYFPQSSKGTGKKDAANMKQFCTSNPDSDAAPKILRSMAVADMDIRGQ